MKQMTVSIVGTSALITHSNHTLADPLHPITQRIKQITTNKKKTDADIHEAYRLEFQAGLYLDGDRVVLPADNVNRMIRDGGAKTPGITGKKAGAYVFVSENAPLIYRAPNGEGDSLADRLWTSNDPSFRLIRPVRLNRGASTVIRARPIFQRWAAEIQVHFDQAEVEESKVLELFTTAGREVGICEWRPGSPSGGNYGRFEVLEGADADDAKRIAGALKALKASA